jgi:hypothetical protein
MPKELSHVLSCRSFEVKRSSQFQVADCRSQRLLKAKTREQSTMTALKLRRRRFKCTAGGKLEALDDSDVARGR